MYFQKIFWLSFLVYCCGGQNIEVEQIRDDRQEKYKNNRNEATRSSYSILSGTMSQVSHESAKEHCNDDIACLAVSSSDRLELEAIKSLHKQLDDDANGNIDLTESDDFLREELKYDSGYERRQKVFHRNDDMHISVRELWEAWLKSEVHNWTVEQTSEWLAMNVDLPQYVANFIQHKVNGATLPRLAVNNMNYLNALGIKDPIHKQKIALKAMDVVLFGPPKDSNSYWKDLTLVTLLFGAVIGCWYTYLQRKKSRIHLRRMMKDMESLHKAEIALEDLQKELERAKLAQENEATAKQNLEKKLLEASSDSLSLHASSSDLEVSQLKAEIEMLRMELQIAEGELKDRCWSPPLGLQQWLQLTHELENKTHIKKKIAAEKQLQQAREACEKLRKKRSSLVGAFVSTHGKSIDEVDRSIVEARTSLNEVTQELQERVHRWKQIELLCGFTIINNNGLANLENLLYRNTNGRPGLKGRMSSQDDLEDDSSSIYTSSAGHMDAATWKDTADSSGSEGSKEELTQDGRNTNNVHFLVGGELTNWNSEEHVVTKFPRPMSQPPISLRSSSHNNINNNTTQINRSQSQELSITSGESLAQLSKGSQSDSSLEANRSNVKHKFSKDQPLATQEEETYSTDSSTIDEEIKRRKRKLFPPFTKKKEKKVVD